MANEMNTTNVVAMLKETASFCRDAQKFFYDVCIELENEDLIVSNGGACENFFYDKEGCLEYNYYIKANSLIHGFRLLIAYENTDEYERYEKIVNKLGVDKQIPLLCIYGYFEPVIDIEQSFENIQSMMDACCGLTSEDDEKYDWANFDEKNIGWNTNISIETKEWTPEVGTSKNYPNWNEYFSKANIKYKPLLELQNRADVENFANEIKAMSF
jgi:hypothetical protein